MDPLDRTRRRLAAACRDAPSTAALLTGIQQALAPAVATDRWCALTLDPSTSLATGGVHTQGISEARVPRLLELEFGEGEFNLLSDLARAPQAAATMSGATGGAKHHSARYREVLQPEGLEHEMRAVFRDASGPWGALILMRGGDRPDFTAGELALVSHVAEDITRAIRRILLLAEIEARVDAEAPALILLGGRPGLDVRHASASAAQWLAEIDDGTVERLPYALYSLALQARGGAGDRHMTPAVPQLARIRTRAGRWLTVTAEALNDADGGVSLILQASHPHEVAQVLAGAYGLTPRETEVVRLVAAGCSNTEIAGMLFVSRYTVEDHLKNLFAKLAVGSRSALVSKLFRDQYVPRTMAGDVVGGNGWFVAPSKVRAKAQGSRT